MNTQLNRLPAGFITLSKDCEIMSINHTLLKLLSYDSDQLVGKSVHTILSKTTRPFFQLIFYPLITEKKEAEEINLDLMSKSGEEVPVLLYASMETSGEITCVTVPINKRNAYEDQLLMDKKGAEDSLEEKKKDNSQLKLALNKLEEKQEELLKANKQNLKYKIDTQRELELAKKIQETSLTDPIDNEQVQIESYYNASSELSGDIYGFYQVNEHQYGVILLDVMGHGISSALITMSLESLFQRLISKGFATDLVMKELDDHLHALFSNNEDAWHYCTAIYLFIDTKKQTIEYINAGHPPAFYQDNNGNQKELHSSTPPLGSFEGIDFNTTMFTYSKGARILLYTDGVSEPLDGGKLHSLFEESTAIPLLPFKGTLIDALNEGNDYYKNDDQCFILIDLK